jgi:hypothetical protein
LNITGIITDHTYSNFVSSSTVVSMVSFVIAISILAYSGKNICCFMVSAFVRRLDFFFLKKRRLDYKEFDDRAISRD